MKKFLLALIIVIATPALAFAQSKYVPLIDIPLLTQAGDTGFSGYINFLYSLSIQVGASWIWALNKQVLKLFGQTNLMKRLRNFMQLE